MGVKIDLCCNTRKPEGYMGIDIQEFLGVDRVWNLDRGIPFPDNSADEIRAHDALEHLKDGIKIMKECWRTLKDGGLLDILVPSTDGRGAWQDCSHCSFYNQNSFSYWINSADWMDYYRGKCLYEIVKLETTPMSSDMVCHVIAILKAIKSDEWLDIYEGRNNIVH